MNVMIWEVLRLNYHKWYNIIFFQEQLLLLIQYEINYHKQYDMMILKEIYENNPNKYVWASLTLKSTKSCEIACLRFIN